MADEVVVFTADTEGFDNGVAGMSQGVSRAADAVEMAKTRMVAHFYEQITAMQEVGASAAQMARVQTQTARQMAAVNEINADQMIRDLDRVEKRQQRFVEARKQLALPELAVPDVGSAGDAAEKIEEVGRAGEHAVTGVQSASAAIRALEGNLFTNRRAAEVFISTIGPLSGILTSAFPIIGAVAIGGALVKMGEAAYHAYQNIVNLKGAVEALDKVQITVDKKVESLEDSTESRVEDILSKTQGRGAALRQKYQYQSGKGTDLSELFYTDEVKKLPDNIKADYETLYKNVAPQDIPARLASITEEVGKLNSALDEVNRHDSPFAPKVGAYGPNSVEDPATYYQQRIRLAKDIQRELEGSANNRTAGLQAIQTDTGEADQQEADKRRRATEEAQRKTQELQRKAEEATRKAIEAQRQLWQESDDQLRTAGGDTAYLEMLVWQNRIDALKKGSAGYDEQLRFAQHKLSDTQVQVNREDAERAKRDAAAADHDQETGFDLERDSYATSGRRIPQQMADLTSIQMLEALPANLKAATDRWREAQAAADRYAEEAQKASDKAAVAAAQEKANYELAALAIAQQTGQISRLDAAQQLANIHAQQYADTMAALQKELDRAKAVDPNGAAAINAQAALDKESATHSVQVMQDAANVAGASWSGALKNANAQWVQNSQDSARQVQQLYRQVLDGLNDNLSNLMTGKKANFSEYFRGLAKTMATDGLQRAEGSVLGKLGIQTGKPDGSKANPWSVNVVGGLPGSSGGGIGSMGGGDDGGDDDGDDSGSGIGGFFSKLGRMAVSLFGGGRAVGGGVDTGTTYLVGEAGPELFSPKTSGTIIPNNALGGQSVNYTVQVANGVTPEQMDMHVKQALREYHPQAVRASVQAMQDHNARNPRR